MVVEKVKEISDAILRPGAQLLVLAAGEEYIKTFTEIIERLVKKNGRKGILVSTQWSANALTRRVSLSKLPKGDLKVIDTISLSFGSKLAKSDEFVFLSTPVSLEAILMEIERSIRTGNGEYNFLIFDSLTHLIKHYSEGQLSEFFHFILNRMLEEQCLVMIFDQNPLEGSRISNELSGMMDRTLKFKEGGGK